MSKENMKTNKRNVGKTDYPVERMTEDKLFLDAQAGGFAEFVLNCATPMTIAIQGDWGSGKTSFVNMIMDKARETSVHIEEDGKKTPENYVFVSFNAWQYNQFNMEDELLTNMVTALTADIKEGIPEQFEKAIKKADIILSGVKSIGKYAAVAINEHMKDKTGLDVLSVASDAYADIKGKRDVETHTIKELKDNFQEVVNARLGMKADEVSSEKRLIIFVDDLDRLAPDKAIEVLEILKIFFDCKHCVFLLAIDYSVVVNGVAMKYKGTLSADKGKDFFEKMIQVVYKIPSSLLHTDRYIASILAENGLNKSIAVDFAKLVKAAGKDNPRAIKRFVNSYFLASKMHEYSEGEKLEESVMLFASLVLQHTCEELYEYWLSNLKNLSCDGFNKLKYEVLEEPSEFAISKAQLYRWGLIDKNGERDFLKYSFLKAFFEQLVESVPSEELGYFDYSQELTEEHLSKVVGSLKATDVTGAGHAYITEDDCVALLLFDAELSETEMGTVQEAYEETFKRIVTYSSCDEIDEMMNEVQFESIISLDKNEFDKAIEIDTIHNQRVYVNTSMSAYEMAKAAYSLAEKFNFEFVWFKDKAAREVLWSYSVDEDVIEDDYIIFDEETEL